MVGGESTGTDDRWHNREKMAAAAQRKTKKVSGEGLMSIQSDDIERQLDDLRRAFAAKLGSQIEELTAAARPLDEEAAPEGVRGALESLHGLAHKLAGSAGTFGYSQLSDAAKRLEVLCLSILDGDRVPVAAQRVEIQALLAAFEAPDDSDVAGPLVGGLRSFPDPLCPTAVASGTKTVFVVDDDADVAMYLETRLTNFGFTVRVFPDPAGLEQGIAETSPDAIIMDLVFPGDRDAGFHHIETLRARGVLVCPVIVLTVRDDFDARLEAVRKGCDGYVIKPVNIVELAETLDRLITRGTVDPYRALLVDDDPETVGYHALLLKAAGILTLTATDPEEAVARLADFRPDVILMDIKMPKCNGIELVNVIRQMSDDLFHIPVVFITSENTDRQRLLTIRGGGDDFIPKPVNPDVLVSSVLARVERTRSLDLVYSRLKSSEERFHALARSANDAIISTDERGAVFFVNDCAQKVFGHDGRDLLGKFAESLIREENRDVLRDAFVRLSSDVGPQPFTTFVEIEGLRQDGTTFPIEFSLSKWTAKNKDFFTILIRDISERKAEEVELRVATGVAESANQAKSEFLSGMSHELRTPLNAILGFAQLLEYNTKEPLSPSQKDSVQQILKGGTHLLELINEILNLAQIEAGKVGLSIEDVEPGECVEECLALTRPQAEERRIEVVEDFDPGTMPMVRVDKIRFKQVLINLLSNAVKYNRHGGTLTLTCRESPGGALRLSVADTGHGIAEHKHDAVFEPFNRLGAETTEVEGSGLGLTVSRKLVELMGGRIAFESTWGKGSTFWFDVPLAKEGASGEAAVGTVDAAPAKAARSLPLGNHTVLYVEDNLANLRLMEAFIGNFPTVTLISAQDAETGIAMAKDRQPDVIFMDINLPGMDGFEALKHLRRSKETRAIPVVALTANALASNRKKGLDAGFRHYLTKPLNLDRFLDVLAETLAAPRDAE